jgi:hypothetical protein
MSSETKKEFYVKANRGGDFDWATITKILGLLSLIIFIHHATSHTK